MEEKNHLFIALYPPVLYSAIISLAQLLLRHLSNSSHSLSHLSILTGSLIGSIVFFFLYRKQKTIPEKKLPFHASIFLIVMGLTAEAGLARLLTFLHIDRIWGNYENISRSYLNGTPLIQVLSLVVFVPITEELIYRGIMYQQLSCCFSNRISAIFTSVLFGLFHFNLVQGIYAFILSFLLINILNNCRSLKGCILLHATANGTALLSGYWNIFETTSRYPQLAVGLMIIELALLVIFWYFFNRISHQNPKESEPEQ